MPIIKKIFFELLLVLASVFIFRGFWLLLDQVAFLNSTGSYGLMFIFGLLITAIVLYFYHKKCDV